MEISSKIGTEEMSGEFRMCDMPGCNAIRGSVACVERHCNVIFSLRKGFVKKNTKSGAQTVEEIVKQCKCPNCGYHIVNCNCVSTI